MAKFLDLVKEMARCNNIKMKPDEDIDFANLNIPMLDDQAEKLSAEEIQIFIGSCDERVDQIISEHKIGLLDAILDQIFSDNLYYNFYEG